MRNKSRSHRAAIELYYLYTHYYRTLLSHSISYFNSALNAACLGAVAGNNEICLPDFYSSAAAPRLSLPSTSSIIVALPSSPARRLANRIRIFFHRVPSPSAPPRGVFARYVNGTFSIGRRNKRALPSRRFTEDDYCHVSGEGKMGGGREGDIVIDRIDIRLLLESSALNLRPRRPSLSVGFPVCFFFSLPHSSSSRRASRLRHRASFRFNRYPLHIPRTCPEFYGRAIRFRIYPASRRAISGVPSECARGSTFILEVYFDSGYPGLSKR